VGESGSDKVANEVGDGYAFTPNDSGAFSRKSADMAVV
jgi:hypothetical protein